MLCVFYLTLIDQTSYKYHIPREQLEETWSKIVKDKLNMLCRTCRRKLAEKQEKMEWLYATISITVHNVACLSLGPMILCCGMILGI